VGILRASPEWSYLSQALPEPVLDPQNPNLPNLAPADLLERVLLHMSDEEWKHMEIPNRYKPNEAGAVVTGDALVDEGERQLAEQAEDDPYVR